MSREWWEDIGAAAEPPVAFPSPSEVHPTFMLPTAGVRFLVTASRTRSCERRDCRQASALVPASPEQAERAVSKTVLSTHSVAFPHCVWALTPHSLLLRTCLGIIRSGLVAGGELHGGAFPN